MTVVKICNWECARRVGRVGAPPKIFNPPFPIVKVGHLATPGCYSNVFNYITTALSCLAIIRIFLPRTQHKTICWTITFNKYHDIRMCVCCELEKGYLHV